MRSSSRIVLVLFVLGFGVWLVLRNGKTDALSAFEEVKILNHSESDSDSSEALTQETLIASVEEQVVRDRISALYESIRKGLNSDNNQKRIDIFRKWALTQSAETTSGAVITFLNTTEDVDTYGNFRVGKNGHLKNSPSLRIALLDILEEVDPEAAVKYSRKLLSSSQHPEEWAVSLRSLAKYGSSADDVLFLNEKLSELVLDEVWKNNPTSGFLHAFDVVAYSGDSYHLYELESLFENQVSKALSHATILSIDRFHQMHSEVASGIIVSDIEYLDTDIKFRASLMARTNVTIDGGSVLVEEYLADLNRSVEERVSFLKQFPNLNSSFSYNLITGSQLLTQVEMRSRSLAAYELLKSLRNEDAYDELGEEIDQAIDKISKIWGLNT